MNHNAYNFTQYLWVELRHIQPWQQTHQRRAKRRNKQRSNKCTGNHAGEFMMIILQQSRNGVSQLYPPISLCHVTNCFRTKTHEKAHTIFSTRNQLTTFNICHHIRCISQQYWSQARGITKGIFEVDRRFAGELAGWLGGDSGGWTWQMLLFYLF